MDAENREKKRDLFTPGWHRAVQIEMTGRARGILYVEFTDGVLNIVPEAYHNADAYVTASFDHLLDMATGKTTFGKLFMSGQLKVTGNLTKGAEIRQLLTKPN